MSYCFLYGIFHFNLWCSLLWFWVLSAVSLQNLTLNFNCFHISEMWMKIFPLASWWIHLMICWLSSFFLSTTSEVFYINACYCLPSSLSHMLNLQLSSPAFKIFFFFFGYLFVSFLLIFFFFFFYVLWDLFPNNFFLLLVFVLQHSFLDL